MTRAIRHLALATVLALGVVSCGDDVSVTDPDPQANAILQISGDDQVLGTGEESAALVVRVNDQNGQPFPGATVAFSGSGADHSLSASSATTGSNGQASVTMTAGDEAGTVTVAATVAGVGTTSFTLTIEADEPDPEASTLEVVEGDGQTIEANATSAPLVVRVSDQFGSAFEGAEVTFTGDGVPHSLSATTAGTDADGEASVVVTAGGDAGTITVAASVDGLDPVTFTLTVEAPSGDPEAATLVRVSGNGQTIEPGETSAALVVRVDDQFSDPFPGAEVTFTVESGDGTVSSTTQTTGANGQASTTVTAGPTEGALTISASAAGLTPVIFDLTVEAPTVDPEISALVLLSGDGQTIEPSETSAALVVRVEDQFNNPFEGAEVTFAVESGDGTLTSTSETTAADGQASTTVTAGPTEGALTISATVAGLTPVTFNLTVQEAPEATTLVLVSGDGQTIEPGALSSALTVRVDDQDTNPFEGAEVTFAIESGDGTLTSTSETTAANGEASTTVTAGATEGALTISATVAGLTPVTFNLTVQEAPEATTLVLVSGDGQTIEPGALSSALTVRVDDQDTNPFEGAEVTFAIESGDGTLTSTSETTAANGQASTTVTAGATEGALTISATVAGLTPVTFNLTVQVASFFTDFEEYATGAFPSDWTDRGLQAQATSITVEQNVEGNFLEVDIGTTTPEHRGLSWADPGTAQDVRIRASFVPGSGAVPAFVMARGAADDTYYRLQIRNNDLLEIAKLVNNTLTLPIGGTGSGGDATFAYLDTDVVHLEFEVEGNQLRGRAWKNNDTAPAGWTVEITDSEISAAGWVGLGRIHAGTMQVLEFEVTPLD